MKSRVFVTFFFFLFSVPASVCAVEVSEILYDVSSELGSDDKREWIELRNPGSAAVELVGWKVNDGSNHVLNEPPLNGGRGTLTIPAHGYVILADDASVFLETFTVPSEVSVIDTVLSLNNSGDTITLYDANGNVVDSVTYTAEMGASGDGRTLHRVYSHSLLHGSPTPGSANPDDVGVSVVVEEESKQESAPTRKATDTPVTHDDVTQKFKMRVNGPKEVLVGATAFLETEVVDSKGEPISGLTRVVWNFGDGVTAEGSAVEHIWKHPGRYALVVTVSSGKSALTEQRTIVARPANIEFTFIDGVLELRNASSRDLDISHWLLQTESAFFAMPEHSIVLAGEALRFTQDVAGIPLSLSTFLAFPNGAIVATATPATTALQNASRAKEIPSKSMIAQEPVLENEPIESEDRYGEKQEPETEEMFTATSTQVAASALALPDPSFTWPSAPWIISLLAIIGVGMTGVYAARQPQKELPAQGWLIEEID